MKLRKLWIFGAVTCIPLSSAAAQLCTGSAPFTSGSFQAGVSAAFNDNTTTLGGGLGLGGTGPFGQVVIGTTSYDELDGSTFTVGGGAGYQFKLDSRGFAHLCPTASVAFGSGPNDLDVFGDGSMVLDLGETDFSIGLSFGVVAANSGNTQIVPTASLSFASATVKVEDQVSGASDSQTETFGRLGLGVGFVVSHSVTLQPGVTIPFGLEGASTTFLAGVGINFGKPAL